MVDKTLILRKLSEKDLKDLTGFRDAIVSFLKSEKVS